MKKLIMGLLMALVLIPASLPAADPPRPPGIEQQAMLLVDPNSATPQELLAVPGIGPALAQRIVEHRQKNGPFKKVEDLLAIQGIGPKSLEALRPYLKVHPAK